MSNNYSCEDASLMPGFSCSRFNLMINITIHDGNESPASSIEGSSNGTIILNSADSNEAIALSPAEGKSSKFVYLIKIT